MRFHNLCAIALVLVLSASCAVPRAPETARYAFSRQFEKGSALEPRGGTTTGAAVNLDAKPSKAWTALQEEGISDFERDRRAILAMAGDYRASFEFIETVSFSREYVKDRPYSSWATERIYILEDRRDFISLQHVLVMFFLEDGKTVGPFATKHWRQDWTYEPKAYHVYRGGDVWERYEPSDAEREGAWVQEVFHVDDSPRYASIGRWEHTADFSAWRGNSAFRPLPRREFSVRSDYDVLEGVNRHIITSSGWVHEQENLKLSLKDGVKKRYIARESGLNTYDRIAEFDFSAGDKYWQNSRDYWEAVRKVWSSQFNANPTLVFKPTYNGASLIEKHFTFADEYDGELSPEELIRKAESLINPHVQPTGSSQEQPRY